MKIGDGSSWDSVFTDHLLATSVDRKTDINMQILNRGNNLLLRKTSICPPYWNAKNLRAQSPTSSWRHWLCSDLRIPWQGSYLPPFIFIYLFFLTFYWLTVKTSNCVKRQNCCMVLHSLRKHPFLLALLGPAWEKNARRGYSHANVLLFIHLFIYLFHALLDKIKTEWNIQTW